MLVLVALAVVEAVMLGLYSLVEQEIPLIHLHLREIMVYKLCKQGVKCLII